MKADKILSMGGDSRSLRETGRVLDAAFETRKSEPGENTLNLSQIVSHDIREPLVSMVATLKLLKRGYYGKMDEEVANRINELLSNATRLTGIAEEYLERTLAVNEDLEIGVRSK
jgi:light-regulated signal transduction histidine kinase (bacteriophytochrome)